ncbi:hypothetical protein ASD74_23915 [Rhizobium sp. Root564]|nr:hypothetical protein ASD74_23915 [Rhizobium sp. Root564]
MNLDQLMKAIFTSRSQNITVQSARVKHGNQNQVGDYDQITLDINGTLYTFSNQTGSWKHV